jgi:hypothetical protein
MSARRKILLVVTAAAAAATILWLQGRFEKGDARNALTLVREYRSRAGASIPDLVGRAHPGRAVEWSARVDSACFQHVRIEASVGEGAGAPGERYQFVVDINGPAIHPGNEAGKRLLEMLDLGGAPSPEASGSARP